MLPNFTEERKLWRKGFATVIGLDEAGRGPLAGPVVAAAVFVRKNRALNITINDSKKLSELQRETLYAVLTNHEDIVFGVGIVSEKIIDNVNILEATKLAMQKAIDNLGATIKPDFLLLDGNFKLPTKILQKSIIKGDAKVFSIAAASIIAKVTRDKLMQKFHVKYPRYGFDKHKGYGTALHVSNIKQFGACKIHRKTFWPVSGIAKNEFI